MSVSQPNIDHLRIATPCPMGWAQMTGDDRVRFCDQCQLNVYNIAELSRTEVEKLIASSEGRICARLYRRADGTVITRDCPIGLRALRLRVSKRVAAVFAAMVSFGSIVFGQQSSTKKTECVPQTRITRTNAPTPGGQVVSGTVMDRNLAVIAGAKITLTNTVSREAWMIKANDEGHFEFKPQTPGIYSLTVAADFFSTQTLMALDVGTGKSINVDIILEVAATQGLLVGVIALPDTVDLTTSGKTTVINQQMMRRLPIP